MKGYRYSYFYNFFLNFSSSGRKSVARVLCLLRNIRTRLKSCGEGGLDIATAATANIVSNEPEDTSRAAQENIDVPSTTPSVQSTPNLSTVNIKSGNTTASNITSGVSVLQQRNLNEKVVLAQLAKTAGEMLTRK